MSFFAKDANATPNPKAKGTKPPITPASNASASSQEMCTPASRSTNSRRLNSSMGSIPSSRGKSTPPTSDSVDVDMLSSGEEDQPVKAVSSYAV